MQQPFSGLQGFPDSSVLGGRYRIVSKLGSGGMSTVYLAEDLRLPGKRWAVKESRMEGEASHAALAEADMMIRLQHPNLPEIVDYYPPNERGYRYLIMDYIEGETLLQRFERQGRRMPVSQLIAYMLQLCDLFQYLHTRRPEPVVYRDLKPSNLMIDLQERIRLIDFGIARSFKAGQPSDTVAIGTIGFAAPEQFEGRQTDARADLYALGALMYFVLSGGQYYHAGRKAAGELDASLPRSLTGLVEKLLEADPAARCQNAAEVRGELQRVLAEQRGPSSPGRLPGGGAYGPPAAKPRLMAVGSLYTGAGATFAAIAIARALRALGLPHAVLEPPVRQPELYALLFGEKHAPAGYRCYNDARGAAPWGASPWMDGSTLWLPSAPGGTGFWGAVAEPSAGMAIAEAAAASYGSPRQRGGAPSPGPLWPSGEPVRAEAAQRESAAADADFAGSGAALQRLLEGIGREWVVADLGAGWDQPETIELLEAADEVVYVVEPLLHKLESAAARRNLLYLEELRQSGKRVHGLANKAVAVRQTESWLRALPERPACLLPSVDFTLVAEASWQGALVQAHPKVEPQLLRGLCPWLQGLQHAAGSGGEQAAEASKETAAAGAKGMLRKLWSGG